MTRRGIILFALLGVGWGIPYLLIKIAVRQLDPAMLVFVRMGLATLVLLAEQVDWMLSQGGMAWTTERTATSSGILYNWADKSPVATPLSNAACRSRSPQRTTGSTPSIRVASAVRRATAPGAPTVWNSVLAREAPACIEPIATSSRMMDVK